MAAAEFAYLRFSNQTLATPLASSAFKSYQREKAQKIGL
jgi:hypothetical protein